MDGESGLDYFGTSISMNDSGNRVVVGARSCLSYNYVRVYEEDDDGEWLQWLQVGNDIETLSADDAGFGGRVGRLNGSGYRLVVGARFLDTGENSSS